MKLDIVSNLEKLTTDVKRYANYLCKSLGMSSIEVDEIVQRTMVDVWQVSLRDGRKTNYDKRHRAGKREKGKKVSEKTAIKPSFKDTYEGNKEYKKWVLSRVGIAARRVYRESYKHNSETTLSTLGDILTRDYLPARPTAIPVYDWE